MSNVLIDRNAVMDYLREQQANVIIEKNKNGFVNADVCDGMSSAIGAFMNFILQIPTAYDVDKVMEQLRKNHDVEKDRAAEYDEAGRLDLMDEHDAKAAAYRNAIKIVKSGGIE